VSPPEPHAYGPDASQFCELFRPAGEPAGAAIVLHGGFWRARYDRTLMHPLCADLAARGWAAWNVEYRRLGAGGGVPATLDDVVAAAEALEDKGGLTPFRLVAIGHSAGGHLAAYLASRVALDGVVSQAGVLDLALGARLGLSNGVVDEFLGAAPLADASPIERLPLRAPTLLTHGGRDDIVPPVISQRYAEAARAAGDEVALVLEPDEDHFGHLDPANPLWRAVTAWLG
jgi:acetyl esterase/lipase